LADGKAQLYFLIATQWREISKLQNIPQLGECFRSKLGRNFKWTRGQLAMFCHRLGLSFPDKGGAPKLKT
jgi:hypothetical protein